MLLLSSFSRGGLKKNSEENIGPILVKDGHLTNRDKEKVKHFFLPESLIILTDLVCPAPWFGGPWVWEQGLFICEHKCEIVRDWLDQLSVHKSIGPDVLQPRALKEWKDVMAGLSWSCTLWF